MYINSLNQGITFARALPTSKKEDYKETMLEAKRALNIEDGLSLLKIDAAAMPTNKEEDTGMGKLNTDTAAGFIDYISFYTGANAVKTFPSGQATKHRDKFYCPYLKTAITTGEEHINLFNLASEKYGNILNKKNALEFTKTHNTSQNRIDFENELGTDENYPILKPLRKAYDNFKQGLSTPELEAEFKEFKNDPFVEENYTRLALFPLISESEPDLFKNFNEDTEKQEKFEEYKEQYKDEIDFFKFRQFIAQKEFKEGKERINANGQKLFGDCLIGFSNQEIWAHPDAFMPNTSIGLYTWGLPALKFDEILKEGTEANKVFTDKTSYFLKNFDGIRFDVGWCYAIARTENDDHIEKHFDMGHKVFDYIEKLAFDNKGKDFDTKNLVYEMDGFEKLFDWSKHPPTPLKNVRNIISVLTTEYEHNNGDGWGHPGFLKSTGLDEDEFIIGTNNHDGANLRQLAESNEKEDIEKRQNAAKVLSKVLKISPEQILSSSKEFVKAKFAELFTTKHQFFFFTDVLGSKYDDDDQTVNTDNYRFRVSRNYERQYHDALQKGNGLNTMESLQIAMKARGLNKTNKALYNKVSYYADYLRQKGAKTEHEANLEERKLLAMG